MFHLKRPTRDDLAALAAAQAGEEPTYPEIGRTLTGALPDGYHHHSGTRGIGHGDALFSAASEAIREWRGHRHVGALLEPDPPPLDVGSTMSFAIPLGPLWTTASCRIVAVVDDPHRHGFAYGTLPHHPECGEESFLVVHDPDTNEVRLEITAFSVGASLLTRLGGPATRAVQRSMTRRYLDGFEQAARRASGTTD